MALFRVFFIPFFAPSHTNPMAELAYQFAAREVDVTMVITPANGALIRRTINRAALAGHPVRVLHYPFPSTAVGLPEGVENVAAVSTADVGKVYAAADAARGSLDRILREHRPDAVVADFPYSWATEVARDLGIPGVLCQLTGAFPLTVMGSLTEHRPHDGLADGDNGPFLVPNLPDPVEVVKSELPHFVRLRDANWESIRKAQQECFGVVVNTFYELEPAYCDLFRRMECPRAWFCGPFSLWPREEEVEAAAKGHKCIAWLDKQATASVVYVAFGSFLYFSKEQHWEMARGLEASGRPFLWVLKESDFVGGGEGWLPEGFKEKVRGRGIVVRGWVPQTSILNHPATGAFVTHLGWNSMTEALHAGLPMITWPLALEQFVTERLVVDILRVGVRVWDGFRSCLPLGPDKEQWKEEAERAPVKWETVSWVVSRFAAPGAGDEDVEAIRKRASECRAMLRAAVREGGSSYNDLDRLIHALRAFRSHGGK